MLYSPSNQPSLLECTNAWRSFISKQTPNKINEFPCSSDAAMITNCLPPANKSSSSTNVRSRLPLDGCPLPNPRPWNCTVSQREETKSWVIILSIEYVGYLVSLLPRACKMILWHVSSQRQYSCMPSLFSDSTAVAVALLALTTHSFHNCAQYRCRNFPLLPCGNTLLAQRAETIVYECVISSNHYCNYGDASVLPITFVGERVVKIR